MRAEILPILMVLAAPSLAAQRLTPALADFRPVALQRSVGGVPAGTPALFPPAPDYRWEGFGIGATAAGIFMGVVTLEFCTNTDAGTHGSCVWPVVGSAIGAAVIGGVIGGFIGATIPKTPADSTSHS